MLEQMHPTEALALSAHAEASGFTGVMVADRFQPWVPQQGQAFFVEPVAAKRAGRTVDEGAREIGKTSGTKVRRLHLSWAPIHPEAITNALTEWPNVGMRFPRSDIRSPLEFEQLARLVRPEDFEGRMLVSDDLEEHRAHIQRDLVDVSSREVLPKLVA